MKIRRLTNEVHLSAIVTFLKHEFRKPPEQRSEAAVTFFTVLQHHVERAGGVYHIRSFAIQFHDTLYIRFRDGREWGFYVLYDTDRGIYILRRILPIEPTLEIALVPKTLPIM